MSRRPLTIFALLFLISQIFSQECFIDGECNEVPTMVTTAPDEYQCLGMCQGTTDCNWFTWYSDTVCLGFNQSGVIDTDCDGKVCISGEKTCQGSIIYDFLDSVLLISVQNVYMKQMTYRYMIFILLIFITNY